MKNQTLLRVALRYRALYLDINREDIDMSSKMTAPVLAFTARLKENGFCISEELLHALCGVSPTKLAEITDVINDVMGVNLNWAPLVKGWNIPTGESLTDHIVTLFANIFSEEIGFKGVTLPCGHLIPEGTFPIERYNGCPFCGTQFDTADFVYKGQGSKLKELRLFTDKDMQKIFNSLLSAVVPLDANEMDSVKKLISVYDFPEDATISIKETAMIAVRSLVENGKADQASRLLATPTDILRFLWFEKTGNVKIIEPKTLIAHARRLYKHMWEPLDKSEDAAAKMKEKLMLKYNRKECQQVAMWMNNLHMSARQAAENMNPKRGMWVRMIRALRMGEYSRRKGYEHLAEILDMFYKQDYTTWQGKLDKARSQNDAEETLNMLKLRPGLFARCLFATMLRFGSVKTMTAFDEVADKLPGRLLLSLGNSAESYFNPRHKRLARPITGGTHQIDPNRLLGLYSKDELEDMVNMVNVTYVASMQRRFAALPTESKTIYIDPMLSNIPVSVGDRATTIQDTSCALMGTRFPIEGDSVRLFLQWGKGLHAQHLDMDLSCRIAFEDGHVKDCAYYNLTTVGAKHSGDIRSIPEMVGTAEYIELSIPELIEGKAKYVTFTCNAYSCGSLSPNLVVGWMNSAYPMLISEKRGVAYDPSCVQHMVRISENNISKGLVFGVLDIDKREIIWIEMPFTSQNIQGCNISSVEALLKKLQDKLTIGQLLLLKAEAQHLEFIDNPEEADEAYTYEWALSPAEVSKLLDI